VLGRLLELHGIEAVLLERQRAGVLEQGTMDRLDERPLRAGDVREIAIRPEMPF
jgi:hypothetical protein